MNPAALVGGRASGYWRSAMRSQKARNTRSLTQTHSHTRTHTHKQTNPLAIFLFDSSVDQSTSERLHKIQRSNSSQNTISPYVLGIPFPSDFHSFSESDSDSSPLKPNPVTLQPNEVRVNV